MPSAVPGVDVDALADVEVDVAVRLRPASARGSRGALPVPAAPSRRRRRAPPTTSCAAEPSAEVRGDRRGRQAERDHQQVERAGGELGGDGDARRHPPERSTAEKSIELLGRRCQCRRRAV